MFKKVLIANRGEIALRVQRTCKELGIATVCVYSEADRNSKYVKLADEAICIGPAEADQSYLNPVAVIAAAEVSEAEAIHPGYGFLSENADFAEKVEASGFVFIGPRPETIRVMGDKVEAKAKAKEVGLTMVPSFNIDREAKFEETAKAAAKLGYPMMVKAAAGGGGRGMRIIHTESMLRNSIGLLAQECERAFGDGTLYAEKLLSDARHVEVQILADAAGNVIHLGTRDCSVQRRHQKLIEEAPATNIPAKKLARIGEQSVEACRKVGYLGAGTIEYLYDGSSFYFIEMNTRIQVEHPVTEMVTGVDIVEQQLRIAAGEELAIRQRDVAFEGHALECRINAEDPVSFLPSPGTVTAYHPAGGYGVRVDSHAFVNCEIPHHYDSLVGKVIVHGATRPEAIRRMQRALGECVFTGIKTNIALHQRILENSSFRRESVGIDFMDSMK
ncbi:MAG: acetyl-CoA carboxylase biotin carboxylase subunit [Betaproteobacteria bacterium AqS2]|uniref:Biotin carboxylase n=1 Tax=Candidatus Amphirhobacter heronislandensis TaxID=1732024 RepID=A0A930Y2E8_9GAMM|nr:acetyl-CoA carboxylase biotin carboxylase subunit [Betaproteobacteria bacterium AqS2]